MTIASINGSEILLPRLKIKLGEPNADITVSYQLHKSKFLSTGMLIDEDILFFVQQLFELLKSRLNPDRALKILVVGCENAYNIFSLFKFVSNIFNQFCKKVIIEVVEKSVRIIDEGKKWAQILRVEDRVVFVHGDFLDFSNDIYLTLDIAISFISSCYSPVAFKFGSLNLLSNNIRVFATSNLIQKIDEGIDFLQQKYVTKYDDFSKFKYIDKRDDKISYNLYLIEKFLSKSIYASEKLEPLIMTDTCLKLLNIYGKGIISSALGSTRLAELKVQFIEGKKVKSHMKVEIDCNIFYIPINYWNKQHFQNITDFDPDILSYVSIYCSITLLYQLVNLKLSWWKQNMGCVTAEEFPFFKNLENDINKYTALKKNKIISDYCSMVIDYYTIPDDFHIRQGEEQTKEKTLKPSQQNRRPIQYPIFPQETKWQNNLYTCKLPADYQLKDAPNLINDCFIGANYNSALGEENLNFSQTSNDTEKSPDKTMNDDENYVLYAGQAGNKTEDWMPTIIVNISNFAFTFQFEKSYYQLYVSETENINLTEANTDQLKCNAYIDNDKSFHDYTLGKGFCGYHVLFQLHTKDRLLEKVEMNDLLRKNLFEFWDQDEFKQMDYNNDKFVAKKINKMLEKLSSEISTDQLFLEREYWLSDNDVLEVLGLKLFKENKAKVFIFQSKLLEMTSDTTVGEYYRHLGDGQKNRSFWSFNELLELVEFDKDFKNIILNGIHFYFLPQQKKIGKDVLLCELKRAIGTSRKRPLESVESSGVNSVRITRSALAKENIELSQNSSDEKESFFGPHNKMLEPHNAFLTEIDIKVIKDKVIKCMREREVDKPKAIEKALHQLTTDVKYQESIFEKFNIDKTNIKGIETECYIAIFKNLDNLESIKMAIEKLREHHHRDENVHSSVLKKVKFNENNAEAETKTTTKKVKLANKNA